MNEDTRDSWRVVILDDYQGVARDSANWADYPWLTLNVIREHIDDEQALRTRLSNADVIVAMRERTPLRREFLASLPKLKLVVTTGMRNASVDPPEHVGYCGTSAMTSPTVELTWALILGARRRIVAEANALQDGQWQVGVGRSLEGSTLGLIGLGNIGSRMAAIASAFGMRVLAWSQNLTAERAADAGAEYADLDTLLAGSDIVSIHVRLSERTTGLLGERELGLMRSDALLVNTSRAPIVDQQALIAALQQGQLGGAALDVYDVEPLPMDAPIRTAPNVLLTPHLGYVTQENLQGFFTDALEDIVRFRAGDPIRVVER